MLIFSQTTFQKRNDGKIARMQTDNYVRMQDTETGEQKRVTRDRHISSRFLCTAQVRLLANGKYYFLGENINKSNLSLCLKTHHNLLCFRRDSCHFEEIHQW